MANRTLIFYDSEFTGLHQQTTLISIGLCAAGGEEFYGEFTDYDQNQIDAWIRDNVLNHTRWLQHGRPQRLIEQEDQLSLCCGDTAFVRAQLQSWLARFEAIEFWGDCLAYDWVLFCQLFGGALHVPSNVFYMPQDLSTLFNIRGIDPDVSRERFSGLKADDRFEHQHNALWDARLIRACHGKLLKTKPAAENGESQAVVE